MKPSRKILFAVICLNPTPNKMAEEFSIRAMPFGALCIISYCKKHVINYKCEFSILEIYINDENTENKFMERVKEFKPDIVGFSAMFNDFCPVLFKLAKTLKDNDKKIFTVAGGIGVSDTHDEFFDFTDNIDAICFSEGELPFSALLSADDLYEFVENHKSWLTSKSVKSGKKPAYELLDNINEIPPFYNLIDVGRYALQTITRKDSNPITMFPMVTTRGFPYNCNFCSVSFRSGKKVRAFSADRVISDIRTIVNSMDVDLISFRDDQFLLDKSRAIAILKYIAELGISASPENGINISLLDEEIVYWFKQANVAQVSIPIESGSERMLEEVIKKPLKLKQVKPVVDLLRKYDIVSTGHIICGMPGETPNDCKMTEKFIEDTGFNGLTFFVATPLKGTRLYDECIEKGYIKKTDIFEKKSFFNGLIKAPYIDPFEITKYAYYLTLKYNFIKNYEYSHGNYEKAAVFFKRVSDLDPFHAISHYCLANTYEKLENKELRDKYMNMYKNIINTDPEWREHAVTFGLELNPQ